MARPDDETVYGEDSGLHVGSLIVSFLILVIIVSGVSLLFMRDPLLVAAVSTLMLGAIVLLFLVLLAGFKINAQWEEAVILRLGRYSRTARAGYFFIIPFLETFMRRDMRVITTTFSAEEALTKDSVPVNVDAVLFWQVVDSKRSVVEVQNYSTSVNLAAMTTLRNTIGQTALAELLSEREKIDEKLQQLIGSKADKWGLNVGSVEIREVRIPAALQDAMSRQAQAERERQARITLGDSEIQIAAKFEEASRVYEKNPEAMKLRAMNMLFEAVKEKGSFIIVPSDVVSSMGFSTSLGLTAAVASEIKKRSEK